MSLILHAEQLTDSRIRRSASDLGVSNPQLVENCLHAFALLGYLSQSGLPFLFKGGTSVLLHAARLRRLSIDIDIMSSVSGVELENKFRDIATKKPFTRLDEDVRDFRGQPNRRHFRFFYPSMLVPGQERNVLLDVVNGDWSYLEHERKSLSLPWMEVVEEAQVTIPTVPALLGDKLTAFAPNTIGVRYTNADGEEGDLMQIGKQLFDIGELFGLCPNLSSCHGTHRSSFAQENGYRNGQFTYEQVLADSLAAALVASFRNPHSPENHDRMIQRCVRPLASHLVGCSFGAAQAAEAAGKVAILIALLKDNKPPSPMSPESLAVPRDLTILRNAEIRGPWSFLTKLKGSAPHAFHYWQQASMLHHGKTE